jgi:hypothetical protein
VDDFDAMFKERRRDHQEAMAFEWVFFGAHKDQASALQFGEHALDSLLKTTRGASRPIVDQTVLAICFRVIWSPTEFLTQEEILNALILQKSFEDGLIVLRMPMALRTASDVGQR